MLPIPKYEFLLQKPKFLLATERYSSWLIGSGQHNIGPAAAIRFVIKSFDSPWRETKNIGGRSAEQSLPIGICRAVCFDFDVRRE